MFVTFLATALSFILLILTLEFFYKLLYASKFLL